MLATVQYHPSDERVNWRISIILRVGLVFNESALCEPQSALIGVLINLHVFLTTKTIYSVVERIFRCLNNGNLTFQHEYLA